MIREFADCAKEVGLADTKQHLLPLLVGVAIAQFSWLRREGQFNQRWRADGSQEFGGNATPSF